VYDDWMVSAIQCILMHYRCVYFGNVKLLATAASADFLVVSQRWRRLFR